MLGTALAVAAALSGPAADAHAFAVRLAARGPRPAASRAEKRAQDRVRRRFAAAGLELGREGFKVPGIGRSRNVYGIRDVAGADCLRVVMAHSDTVPPSPGAHDNASGLGALIAIAPMLRRPRCDTWLVATGAEERIHTGQDDHLGALAVARRINRRGRRDDLEFGLSLDEVGRGRTFWLRSPAAAPRPGVERSLLRAARRARVRVRWVRDETTGNSDHRELELAGLPAMKLGVPDDRLRHTAGDRAHRLRRSAFRRALEVVVPLLRT